jgi:hypothetical protein
MRTDRARDIAKRFGRRLVASQAGLKALNPVLKISSDDRSTASFDYRSQGLRFFNCESPIGARP